MNTPAENEWVTGNVKINVRGQPLEMQMTVPAKPVKLSRMLPVLQSLTNSFVNLGEQAVAARGETVSCAKGCGACCRQPVPIAEVEAFQLAELVENLPEPRRAEVKQRFQEGAAHFHEIGWFERVENCPPDAAEKLESLVGEYFQQGVACPFLVDESCSIHQERPLACREYLVTSPPENCAKPERNIKGVPLLFQPSTALAVMSNVSKRRSFIAVPLILALEWAEKNPAPDAAKTGEQWMAEFFQLMTKSEIPPPAQKKMSDLS
jgi:Fe-S-cluster containining protein